MPGNVRYGCHRTPYAYKVGVFACTFVRNYMTMFVYLVVLTRVVIKQGIKIDLPDIVRIKSRTSFQYCSQYEPKRDETQRVVLHGNSSTFRKAQ